MFEQIVGAVNSYESSEGEIMVHTPDRKTYNIKAKPSESVEDFKKNMENHIPSL